MVLLSQRPKLEWSKLHFFVLANLLDIFSTYIAVGICGYPEGNPILSPIVDNYGLTTAMEFKLVSMILVGLFLLYRNTKGSLRIMNVLSFLFLIVVFWNVFWSLLVLV